MAKQIAYAMMDGSAKTIQISLGDMNGAAGELCAMNSVKKMRTRVSNHPLSSSAPKKKTAKTILADPSNSHRQ
jgi:hypothetical protein